MENLYIVLLIVLAVLAGAGIAYKTRKKRLKESQKTGFKMIQNIVIVHTNEQIWLMEEWRNAEI